MRANENFGFVVAVGRYNPILVRVPIDISKVRRLKAIEELLDDPTPSVRRAILVELVNLGEEGRQFILECCKSGNLVVRLHAHEVLAVLDKDSPVKMFHRFIRSLNYELESGYILLSRIDNRQLEVSEYIQKLDEMAARCQSLIYSPMSPREKCRVLNRVIFHEYGFTGNRADFNNPNNTFLHTLFKTRKGLPISLSILYLLVARRLEMPLEPVGIPGRFMVGCFVEDKPFFIDVFENGIFRSIEDVVYYIERNRMSVTLGLLGPCPVGEVLCRCCRNLSKQFAMLNDHAKAELYGSFAYAFEAHFEKEST